MRFRAVEVCNAATDVGVLFKRFFPIHALGGAGSVSLLQTVHTEGLVEVCVCCVGFPIRAVSSQTMPGF